MKRLITHTEHYKVSLIGIGIIVFTFLGIGPMFLNASDQEVRAVFILSSIAALGICLGTLVGIPKLSLKIDIKAIMIGLIAFAAISVCKISITTATLLSVSNLIYIYAAVCEELGFRFGLLRFLEKIVNPHIAILAQAATFQIYHYMVYPGYETITIFPLVSGLVLGYTMYYSKNLTSPLIAHALNNLF